MVIDDGLLTLVEGVTSATVSQKDKGQEIVSEVAHERVNDADNDRQHSESVQASMSSNGLPSDKEPSFIELGDLMSSSGLPQQQQHSAQSTVATHPADNHTTDERLHVYDYDDDIDFDGSEDVGVGKRSADANENERQLTGAARLKQKRRRLLDKTDDDDVGDDDDDCQSNNYVKTTLNGNCSSSSSPNRRLQRTPRQRSVARRKIMVTRQQPITATAPAAALDGDVAAMAVNGESGNTADVVGCEHVGDNMTSTAASDCHQSVPDDSHNNNNNNNNNNKVQELSSPSCCAVDILRLSAAAFHNDSAHSQFSLSSHFRRGE